VGLAVWQGVFDSVWQRFCQTGFQFGNFAPLYKVLGIDAAGIADHIYASPGRRSVVHNWYTDTARTGAADGCNYSLLQVNYPLIIGGDPDQLHQNIKGLAATANLFL